MKKHKTIITTIIVSLLLICFFSGCAKQPEQKPLSYESPVLPEEPTITIYYSATGATESMPMEEYLKGVVAAEIGDKFPLEALKAQAIAARTMTMAKIEYEGGVKTLHNTDVSDDHKEFQAYDKTKITDKIAQAIDETRGQFVLHQGKYAYTLFHSSSKTRTASIEEGFPNINDTFKNIQNYIVPVDAHSFNHVPDKYKDWEVRISKGEMIGILGSKAGNLYDIQVSARGPSGRATTISVGQTSIPAAELRQKIGPDRLYSTDISDIRIEDNNVVFTGNGWGHGCGLEQYGAMELANQDKKADEIVLYYYPNTELKQLYQ